MTGFRISRIRITSLSLVLFPRKGSTLNGTSTFAA